jgi:hypothetical protein
MDGKLPKNLKDKNSQLRLNNTEEIMADTSSTPQHCPGYADFKNLKVVTCKCTKCGQEKEIFSDEFDKAHTCSGCGEPIDFAACTVAGEGKSISPR